jgi:hypothetical protein
LNAGCGLESLYNEHVLKSSVIFIHGILSFSRRP